MGGPRALESLLRFVKRHRTGLGYLVSGAGLVALSAYLYRHWQALAEAELAFDYPLLAFSLLLMTVSGLVPPFLWSRMMRHALRADLDWRTGFKIWYLSQITRYLPGGVWQYLSRVELCSQQGVAPTRTTLSLYLETILILIAQVTAFVVTLPFWTHRAAGLYWTVLVIPLGLVAVHPALISRTLAWIGRLRGQGDPLQIHLTAAWQATTLACYVVAALWGGTAFYLMVRSIYPVPLSLLPVLAGIVNVSATVGFLVLIAPGGLGVREGVLAFLLSLYLPAPVAVTISLASRVWLTLAELLGLGFSLLLQPKA
jgi:hypothetical protein